MCLDDVGKVLEEVVYVDFDVAHSVVPLIYIGIHNPRSSCIH